MEAKPDPRGTYEEVMAGFRRLEVELGAPPGSLVSLITSEEEHDDWSFVIRAHAIIEGAVSQMLAAALDPRLGPVFDRLELGRSHAGKLEFVKALGLLTDEQLRFVKMLSLLRNECAHDLRHLDFTFHKYVDGLDKQQTRAFTDALTSFVPPEGRETLGLLVHEAPRAIIAANIQVLLKDAVERGSFAKISREEADYALQQVIGGQLVSPDDFQER